jgi:hypothetical protein
MNILTIPEFGAGISARVVHNSQEKVLWIHGYTLDSSIWKHLWQHLPRWQHIAIDLPGHGLSAPIENGETLLTLADRIGELADCFANCYTISSIFYNLDFGFSWFGWRNARFPCPKSKLGINQTVSSAGTWFLADRKMDAIAPRYFQGRCPTSTVVARVTAIN